MLSRTDPVSSLIWSLACCGEHVTLHQETITTLLRFNNFIRHEGFWNIGFIQISYECWINTYKHLLPFIHGGVLKKKSMQISLPHKQKRPSIASAIPDLTLQSLTWPSEVNWLNLCTLLLRFGHVNKTRRKKDQSLLNNTRITLSPMQK